MRAAAPPRAAAGRPPLGSRPLRVQPSAASARPSATTRGPRLALCDDVGHSSAAAIAGDRPGRYGRARLPDRREVRRPPGRHRPPRRQRVGRAPGHGADAWPRRGSRYARAARSSRRAGRDRSGGPAGTSAPPSCPALAPLTAPELPPLARPRTPFPAGSPRPPYRDWLPPPRPRGPRPALDRRGLDAGHGGAGGGSSGASRPPASAARPARPRARARAAVAARGARQAVEDDPFDVDPPATAHARATVTQPPNSAALIGLASLVYSRAAARST